MKITKNKKAQGAAGTQIFGRLTNLIILLILLVVVLLWWSGLGEDIISLLKSIF